MGPKARRPFALLLFAVTACVGSARTGGEPRPPNIVVILADDLGYGDLSCQGQARFTTPRIDELACAGMRFTQSYAGCTVCAPSRATLLTGQHTGHVWQRGNGEIAFRDDPLDPCIATRLRAAGYTTAMIGKSGLSCASTDAGLPGRKGFDHFFGFQSHWEAHRHFPAALYRDGETVHLAGNGLDDGRAGSQYVGELFVEDALRFLDAQRDHPFFLHLSLQEPHADLDAPAEWRARFAGHFDERAQHAKDGQHYRFEPAPRATFAAMVAWLDDAVGRVTDRLRALGLAEDTLVIFTSDNGAHHEGGHDPDFFDSTGGLRGHKRDLYEGGLRVPFLAAWPGRIPAGTTSDLPIAFWDFAPTACELAGIDPPEDTDGISIAPTLLARGRQRSHPFLYWEFHEQGGKQAVRMDRWKGVRLDAKAHPTGPLELYDLETDPRETTDVAAAHPDIVAALALVMAREHVPTSRYRFGQ